MATTTPSSRASTGRSGPATERSPRRPARSPSRPALPEARPPGLPPRSDPPSGASGRARLSRHAASATSRPARAGTRLGRGRAGPRIPMPLCARPSNRPGRTILPVPPRRRLWRDDCAGPISDWRGNARLGADAVGQGAASVGRYGKDAPSAGQGGAVRRLPEEGAGRSRPARRPGCARYDHERLADNPDPVSDPRGPVSIGGSDRFRSG